MTEEEKKKVAQRLTSRVSTGVSFIELNYLNLHPTPDSAWIRNIYILLSFYSELLLKAIFVIKGNFKNLNDLDDQLRMMRHNLKTAGLRIGKADLSGFGILEVGLVGKEYVVKTVDGDFYVKDFNDIRYDFLDDKVRILNGDEHEMFKKQIEIMYAINAKLKPLVW